MDGLSDRVARNGDPFLKGDFKIYQLTSKSSNIGMKRLQERHKGMRTQNQALRSPCGSIRTPLMLQIPYYYCRSILWGVPRLQAPLTTG